MNNTGIHHISSLVGNIHQAYHFYHHILGLKLTLKTVNQEDSSMYHLFFGDDEGRFGTEFTIFDMPIILDIGLAAIVWNEPFFWLKILLPWNSGRKD
ncbi:MULTISPECIES: VOC family protein [Streptococcus]|uniref:VOC family protein n=1 Tax=Streptococcus suis TaxID=1307 RepID=A0A9X4MLR9_STRSU|nr:MULTISPECIES: VOC family protein [Streptococcus]MDG4515996.1 VOC family protein [Streptococcus suis]MDG4527241.1 VOC family protein [Streptococcus suis]MDG4529210.1 VOC family protein [Streptococcus suis]